MLRKLLGLGPKVNLAQLVNEGALILDVRTKDEFNMGHVRNSVNVPLNTLPSKMGKLKKDQVIITCCASGMRSASAKSMLKASGFKEVHNGGGWATLNRKLGR